MTAVRPGPLRVCHVIHGLGPGGAEQVLTDLAAVAAGAGLDLTVVALSEVPDPVHARALRDRGVPVVELGLRRWDPRVVGRLAAAVRAAGARLLHTHLKHADIAGAAAGRLLGLPVVSTLHVIEDGELPPVARIKRRLGAAARVRGTARTIAVSHAQRSWYLARTGVDPASTVVVPNGVVAAPVPSAADRAAARAAVREEIGAGPGDLIAVVAALMRPEKGHHLLMDALRLLPADLGLVVAVAGDGPLYPEIAARVAADPLLRARVRLLGYRTDVPRLVGGSDLVLHPSAADALPTALIQGLAAGVPAVACDVGGASEVLGTDCGVLVPVHDPAALADAVTAVCRQPSWRHRMGVAARQRFEAEFDARLWADRLRALYDEVLREGR